MLETLTHFMKPCWGGSHVAHLNFKMSRVGVSQGWKLKVNPLSLTEFLKRRVKVHCEKNSTVLSLTYS